VIDTTHPTPSHHLKPPQAHKCPEIAALQLKLLGPDLAPGVCAQKVRDDGRRGRDGPVHTAFDACSVGWLVFRDRGRSGLGPLVSRAGKSSKQTTNQLTNQPTHQPKQPPRQVSEAEALVGGGVADVLLSNQVVAPGKMRRLAALAAGGGVSSRRGMDCVCVWCCVSRLGTQFIRNLVMRKI
jgi:hypothetical protein